MSKFRFKPTDSIGLFDKDETSNKLSKLENPLENYIK